MMSPSPTPASARSWLGEVKKLGLELDLTARGIGAVPSASRCRSRTPRLKKELQCLTREPYRNEQLARPLFLSLTAQNNVNRGWGKGVIKHEKVAPRLRTIEALKDETMRRMPRKIEARKLCVPGEHANLVPHGKRLH